MSIRPYETAAVAQKQPNLVPVEPVTAHQTYSSFQKLCSRWSTPPVSKQEILVKIRDSTALAPLFSDTTKLQAALDSLIQSKTPHLLIHGLDIAVQAGSTLKPALFEHLCYRLASEKRWDVIIRVVESASRVLHHLSTRLLNWRARSLIELQDYRAASGILAEFEHAKQIPNQLTYHILISGCLRNSDMHGAKHLLQAMHRSEIPTTPELHSLIVQHYRDYGLNQDILQTTLQMLPSLKRPVAVELLNSLIQMSLDSSDYETTLQLIDHFSDISTRRFRSLLFQHTPDSLSEDHDRAHAYLNLQLDADSTTASFFMNWLVTKSVYMDAVQLGEDTLSTTQAPTENFVASLINAYFTAGQGDKAIALLAHICSQTSQRLFQSLKNDMNHEEYDFHKVGDLSPSIKLFNALLKGICNRNGDKATVVFDLMERNNVQPNSRTVEILLSFIKSKAVHPRVLVHALKGLTSHSIPVNVRHLHHIISAIASYDKHVRFGRGWNTFAAKLSNKSQKTPSRMSLMQSASSSPTAGITVQDQPSYRKLLRPFLRSLSERGVKSDAAMLFLRLRLDALDSDMDSAQSIFKMLVARGIRPNRYHFSALVEGYARKGDFPSAQLALESASKLGVPPTVEMYTSIIASYARRHDPISASQTFQRMFDREIRPDVGAIDALVSSYYAVGAYKIARQMLITLWKYIGPFPEDKQNVELALLIKTFRALDQKMPVVSLTKHDRVRIYNQITSLIDSYQRHFR